MKESHTRSMRWRSISILVLGLMLGSFGSGVGMAAKEVTKKKADRKLLQNTTIVQQTFTVGDETASPLTVLCPAGQQATGGGIDSPALLTEGGSDAMVPFEQRPVITNGRSTGWYAEVAGEGTGVTATIYAVCSK